MGDRDATSQLDALPESNQNQANDDGDPLPSAQVVIVSPLNSSQAALPARLQHLQHGSEAISIVNGRGGSGLLSSHISARVSLVQSSVSAIHRLFRSSTMISATLVDDEVIEAEPVHHMDRNWKCIVLSIFAVLVTLSLTLGLLINRNPNESNASQISLSSQVPTPSPTFDPRSTLDIVQSRGVLRCGLEAQIPGKMEKSRNFRLDLCRAIAAVVLGTADSIYNVTVTGESRFIDLKDRKVDLLLFGDTHTLEREVRERTTGIGFTFSEFYYDGMRFFGEETYVNCAEEQKRFGVCKSLQICVQNVTTHYDFVLSSFPSTFYRVVENTTGLFDELMSGRCNVVAGEGIDIYGSVLNDAIGNGTLIVGDKLFTKEPLAVVTRKEDSEWSDIVNWVIQAIIFGEENGLKKNSSLCLGSVDMGLHPVNMSYLNAVYCVGNFGQILSSNFGGPEFRPVINTINNGTGMLYSIPLGDMNANHGEELFDERTLDDIRNSKILNCGIVDLNSFPQSIVDSANLTGMGEHYCHTLSAAMFSGNFNAVKFRHYSITDDSSFADLGSGKIDVLVGRSIHLSKEFEQNRTLGSFSFSRPYFYGDGISSTSASSFSLVTREDDYIFSSFVNGVVLATIYAKEFSISKRNSREMPLIPFFGTKFLWMFRDAIAFSGGYEEIYSNFIDSSESARGRNSVNYGHTPQLLSFPGLGL